MKDISNNQNICLSFNLLSHTTKKHILFSTEEAFDFIKLPQSRFLLIKQPITRQTNIFAQNIIICKKKDNVQTFMLNKMYVFIFKLKRTQILEILKCLKEIIHVRLLISAKFREGTIDISICILIASYFFFIPFTHLVQMQFLRIALFCKYSAMNILSCI